MVRHLLFPRLHKLALVLVFSTVSACAVGFDESEVYNDLIHADLPLFGYQPTNIWPQPIHDMDDIGCASRVAFGDWALFRAKSEKREIENWYRIRNYGKFHCFAMVTEAYQRKNLKSVEGKRSFFVELDTSADVELWALQMGGAPGSDYLLLSRQPADEVISKFTVLQSKCPKGNVRDAGAISIFKTRYCAINSKAEMLDLARRMSKLAPLGDLVFVEPEQAPEFENEQSEQD